MKWKKIRNYSRLAVQTLIVPSFQVVLDSISMASVLAITSLSLENAFPLGLVSVLNFWPSGTVVDLDGFVTTKDLGFTIRLILFQYCFNNVCRSCNFGDSTVSNEHFI